MHYLTTQSAALTFLSFSTFILAQTQDNYTHAEQASQKLNTWYKSDKGLWGYQTGWWNSANCLTAQIDLALADGNVVDAVTQQLATTFQNAQIQNDNVNTVNKRTPATLRRAEHALAVRANSPNEFKNDYYDDEGWWALAWIAAYDLTQNVTYLDAAANIFLDMTGGWPSKCGGVWWDKNHSQVNAIANELFIASAAALAIRDTNSTAAWTSWAEKGWSWFKGSGLINDENLINDHLDEACENAHNETVWSYNQGVILGGLVDLAKVTGDDSYMQEAQTLATASIAYLADNSTHVLTEPGCEGDNGCNPTSDQFKGAYIRNLVKLNKAAPDDSYKEVLLASGNSAWHSNGNQVQLHENWATGEGDANTATQSAALEALVGMLWASR